MIKFGTNPILLTSPARTYKDLESTRHLIVLIPAHMDFNAAAQRIWALAQAGGMQIRLLGLSKDAAEGSRLRRSLITMASLLQDGRTCAEATVEAGTNW